MKLSGAAYSIVIASFRLLNCGTLLATPVLARGHIFGHGACYSMPCTVLYSEDWTVAPFLTRVPPCVLTVLSVGLTFTFPEDPFRYCETASTYVDIQVSTYDIMSMSGDSLINRGLLPLHASAQIFLAHSAIPSFSTVSKRKPVYIYIHINTLPSVP